jgi:hypothetical protein
MKPPAVPDQPVPVLTEPQLRALFAVCGGKDFEGRRDIALLMVLLDAGPRRSELLGMRLGDLDFEYDVVRGRQGRAGAGAAVRPQDRPGPGSLSAGPVTAPARPPERAVDQPAWAAHDLQAAGSARPPRPPGDIPAAPRPWHRHHPMLGATHPRRVDRQHRLPRAQIQRPPPAPALAGSYQRDLGPHRPQRCRAPCAVAPARPPARRPHRTRRPR